VQSQGFYLGLVGNDQEDDEPKSEGVDQTGEFVSVSVGREVLEDHLLKAFLFEEEKDVSEQDLEYSLSVQRNQREREEHSKENEDEYPHDQCQVE